MLKNHDSKSLLVILSVLTLISFCTLILALSPAVIPFFDFSTQQTANIGSTIGGITAPVLTIFTSYLLYITLTRQTESNTEQRLKNESDIIFLLINQMDSELDRFYIKQTRGTVVEKYTGLEALNDFARGFRYDYNIEQFGNTQGHSFKVWYEAGQLAVIIDTFNLIEKRIQLSNLNEETRYLFQLKLDSYYAGKLKIPLSSLSEAFELYPHQKDTITEKIQALVAYKGKTEFFASADDHNQ
ncbi:hypothetical protein SAMN05428975_3098 [Mucilaginibacter sp. OK268]|uniref:hypothetical protein n=1 Tax=Mucilaginibacter sp. OK268 TaxID=1881048 RepID=UPI0008920899|nr:hypothetical protein [Mucilaginibacter sp. OK268]SDP86107.1 hypothetical protein SAMN05428975_3098 [Mucilaginibacter sp. OK268]